MSNELKSDDNMIAALLRERASLVVRGLDDRVAQVDEQLRLRGHVVKDEDRGTSASDDSSKPTGRQAKPRSTAAGS